LIELLNELTVDTDTLIVADEAWRKRLSAYIAARNRFIAAGRHVQPTGDVYAMLAQVHEPLLEVLRISPDFRPAYEPLLQMANALADRDPDAARQLLAELRDVRGAMADH
jgi:spermidine synthase